MQAAQRLRYEVFAGEMGARLDSPVSGLDADRFDAYCDHLIVRAGTEVVGTYRMLPPGRTGRLYSEGYFDLAGLSPEIRSGPGRRWAAPACAPTTAAARSWA